MSAPIATAAEGDVVYSYDIRDFIFVNPAGMPNLNYVTADKGQVENGPYFTRYFSSVVPFSFNDTGGEKRLERTVMFGSAGAQSTLGVVVGPRVIWYDLGGQPQAKGGGIRQDIPFDFQAGKVYRIEIAYRPPQGILTNGTFQPSSGDFLRELGYVADYEQGGSEAFYESIDQINLYSGAIDYPAPSPETTSVVDFVIGETPRNLSVFFGINASLRIPNGGSGGFDMYPPMRITVTDVTPLSAESKAIIDAVKETGDKIIAVQREVGDKIYGGLKDVESAVNNMADRLDPQDKPPLADLNPEDPEPLPEVPTLPGPADVIGADGAAAIQEIWGALGSSDFFKAVMVVAGVAFTLGLIAFIMRKRKEE